MTAAAQSFHDLPREERLALARRGTAMYSGQLSLIDNEDFGEPTLLPGWNVATVVSHVSYNAAALVNLMDWANTGVVTPMYESPEQRGREIAFGATLIPDALRNLHDHTLVRLDVAWRDSSDEAWSEQVKTAQGRDVPAEETLWMRAREVWIHSVDLNQTATFSDIPKVILETLVPEIVGKWARTGDGEGLVLVNSQTGDRYPVTPGNETTEVTGTLAGLARWATGRGGHGVNEDAPTPPRWL